MKEQKPLADLLRPNAWTDFLGQKHLKEHLTALLQAKRLPSLLFFGPPGCGKSTLAILLAQATNKKYIRVSAPEAGVQNLRRLLANTDILVLDELHRFSKSQQDFFLPIVESGEITLLATTTENPSFSVTKQLLSRLHTLRLFPLGLEELCLIAKKGAQTLGREFSNEILLILATAATGDARTVLNLVEYAVTLCPANAGAEEIKKILPTILLRHDKKGDSHYEYISALIKSVRGSDVDASLYYLACLLEGGEDPMFICRRLILLASEDVGLADPQALPLAVACQKAVEFVGMPEGFIPLSETVIYLTLAKKSNSAYSAYLNAAHEVKTNGSAPVPLHLRNATTQLQKEWGYGKTYQYPHDFAYSWVKQDYLPNALHKKRFYFPKENGEEKHLVAWWKTIRDK